MGLQLMIIVLLENLSMFYGLIFQNPNILNVHLFMYIELYKETEANKKQILKETLHTGTYSLK